MLSREELSGSELPLGRSEQTEVFGNQQRAPTIGALIITYTIVGVPYCNYSIMGPITLF